MLYGDNVLYKHTLQLCNLYYNWLWMLISWILYYIVTVAVLTFHILDGIKMIIKT